MGRGGTRGRILWGLAVAGVLAVPPRGAAAPLKLVALRHFDSRDHARLVLELSGPVEPSISTVPAVGEGPLRRIYVDLPGGVLASRVARSLTFPSGPLAGVRVGQADEHTLRVALVARDAAAFEVARVTGPARLILDVRASEGRWVTDQRDGAKSPAKEAAPRSTGRRELPAVRSPSPGDGVADRMPTSASGGPGAVTIVLDPGHGGKDPGASGVGGIQEKAIVLAIARDLAARIEREIGARVVLTRTGDQYLSLEARTARANAVGADLFISIHANASARRSVSGVETYYLNNTDDRATIRLAAMENGLPLSGPRRSGGDLSYILSDLVQQGKLEDSIALSRAVHRGLVDRLRRSTPEVVDLGVKQGPFYVLVGAYMPCVLVEVAFLTHPEEGKRLGTPVYREEITAGLLDGVRAYVQQLRRARTL